MIILVALYIFFYSVPVAKLELYGLQFQRPQERLKATPYNQGYRSVNNNAHMNRCWSALILCTSTMAKCHIKTLNHIF